MHGRLILLSVPCFLLFVSMDMLTIEASTIITTIASQLGIVKDAEEGGRGVWGMA